MSLSPEALVLILVGEAVGSMEGPTTGDRKNETDATETGDAAARNSASSSSRLSLMCVNLGNG